MVFDENTAVTSFPELLECLLCDWGHKMVEPMVSSVLGPIRIEAKAVHYKRLRTIALAQPRWGTACGEKHRELNALGDAVLQRIAALTVNTLREPVPSTAKKMFDFAKKYGTKEHPFGGFQIAPGTGTFENYATFGIGSGASADGRRCNASIASDASASPAPSDFPVDVSQNQYPFSDMLNSATGAGTTAMWDGAPTDFNIDENFSVEELSERLREFAQGKGSNILTITTASERTYAEAVKKVEAYDLLRVRMGGWSAHFTSMFPGNQPEHVRRPYAAPQQCPKLIAQKV